VSDPAGPESKGHLNPGSRELDVDRFELGADLTDLARHVWVIRWSVPDGVVSRQRVLTYPALNAAIEPAEAALHGPDSRVGVRELTGVSWVVGVLFRPAAGPLLTRTEPGALAGSSEPLPPAAPVEAVRRIMGGEHGGGKERDRAALRPVLREWLLPVAAGVDDRGRLVNEACRLAETDQDIIRAADLAARLDLSPRSLERLVRSHVGLSPKWLIECRRLQHAATTLFTVPGTDLSVLAAELGYADYPHFSRRYRDVLGESPRETRDRGHHPLVDPASSPRT
jgi:methylphosphotriester-DNA--protein-cysteine methyltransferase